jgi:predicted RNase H-like nuclease (RuvC/YqgF family)
MDLKQAIRELDPKNDDHWTTNGAPLVALVSELVGREITRQEIIDVAPGLTRDGEVQFSENEPPPEFFKDEETVEAKVKKLDDEMLELARSIGKLETKITELKAERAALTANCRREYNSEADQDRRMHHIRRQNEERARRHAASRAALSSINPKDLVAVSPIDSAMQRRRERGGQRPVRPLKEV